MEGFKINGTAFPLQAVGNSRIKKSYWQLPNFQLKRSFCHC